MYNDLRTTQNYRPFESANKRASQDTSYKNRLSPTFMMEHSKEDDKLKEQNKELKVKLEKARKEVLDYKGQLE